MAEPLKPATRVFKDNNSLIRAKPPHIGYIRTGIIDEKTQKGKPLDHFHLVPANKFHTQYISDFKKSYGDKPSILPLFFYSSEAGHAYTNQHEVYLNKELLAYSDGRRVAILHPLRKQWVYLDKEEILKLPETDDIKKQWNYLAQRKLWRESIEIKFFLKNFPALGLFTYKSIGIESTIPNILRTIDGLTAKLGGFHNILCYLVMHIGHKPGTPRKYVAVDLIPAYSLEQIHAISLGINAGTLDLDRNSYMDIDQYVHQVCPTKEWVPPQLYEAPEYNTAMDVPRNFDEFDEDEAAEIERQFGTDPNRDLLEDIDPKSVGAEFDFDAEYPDA